MSAEKNQRYVLVTGDGEGLGNALVRSLLRHRARPHVIGLSRRPAERVAGYAQLTAADRARYTHVRVDLTSPAERADVVAQIAKQIQDGGGKLAALALVNGTGFLDSEVAARPELVEVMETLNVTAPLELVEGLAGVSESTAPILYYSGILVHPTAHVPCVATHGSIKRRAADALRERWPERLKLVMPGAFRTEMLLNNIVLETAMLEWFAVPMADPYQAGGLSDLVADYALTPRSEVPAQIIRPRLTRLLVTKNTPEQLLKTLPGAIRRAARSILAATGQTDAQHDARVRRLQAEKLYGEDFPYEDVLSHRLWPLWLSNLYAGSLRTARMIQ